MWVSVREGDWFRVSADKGVGDLLLIRSVRLGHFAAVSGSVRVSALGLDWV